MAVQLIFPLSVLHICTLLIGIMTNMTIRPSGDGSLILYSSAVLRTVTESTEVETEIVLFFWVFFFGHGSNRIALLSSLPKPHTSDPCIIH